MYKIAFYVCALISIPLVCFSQIGTSVPDLAGLAATTADCPPGSRISSETVDGIRIRFFCGITEQQRKLVHDYVRYALEINPPGVTIQGDVYVLKDLQQAASVRFWWLVAHGYPESYKHLLDSIGSDCAETERGALFLYLTQQCWGSGSGASNGQLILHEMHHLLQFELSPSIHPDLPAWLEEGGADVFAWQQLDILGRRPAHMTAPSPACNYRLGDLEAGDDPSRTLCIYWEGQQATAWLIGAYGVAPYYQLFRSQASGRTFDDIFLQTYGISAPSFYRLFDQYRRSGYTVAPPLPLLSTHNLP